MKHKRSARILLIAILLIISLIDESVTGFVFAGEDPEPSSPITVTNFKALASNIATQQILWRQAESAINRPSVLKGNDGKTVISGVTWSPDKPFNAEKPAIYIYTARLPKGYVLAAGVSLPKIQVKVAKRKVSVTGINFSPSKTAGKSLTDSIKVSSAYGCKVYLQTKSNGKWVTKATYRTADKPSAVLTVSYPKVWYNREVSSWRIYIPAREGATQYISGTIKVKTKRVFQNPSKYLQIKQTVTVPASGAYKLKKGTMGLKVARVQRKLGMGRRWEIVDNATISKVKVFQRKKKLKANGIVDLRTWMKMGFSKTSWSSMGKYVSPVKVKMTSTRKQCIETMIKTARSYLGDEYIVGAAGKPGTGVDCSGLIMQSMYSAGLNPSPVSVVRHAQPGYEYESRNLWKHSKLKHVKYSKRQRGDLIFYKGRGGAIIHVGIYLGGNQVIESWPDKVRIWPVKNSHRSSIAGVIRPFI